MSHLMLMSDANRITRENLIHVPTPERTRSWVPISHEMMVSQVERSFEAMGIEIVKSEFGVTHDGNRMFGLMQLQKQGQNGNSDYSRIAGIRNSHDKTFPGGLVIGASVTVCSNLSFYGEIKFTRKHTVYIERDLPGLVAQAVGKLSAKWESQDARFAAYKIRELSESTVNDFVVKSMDLGVITSTYIPKVLAEWRKPQHEEFMARNAWSLFNSYTEVLKQVNPFELPKRTIALTGLMDQFTNVVDATDFETVQ